MSTCEKCTHFKMCEWKGIPYEGTHSGEFPAKNYTVYKTEWFELHARLCKEFSYLPEYLEEVE